MSDRDTTLTNQVADNETTSTAMVIFCLFYICFMMYHCTFGVPFMFMQMCLHACWSGIQSEFGFFVRVTTLILVEVVIQHIWRSYNVESQNDTHETVPETSDDALLDKKTETKKVKQRHEAETQTTGPWLKRQRRFQRILDDAKKEIKTKTLETKRHMSKIVKRYKLKSKSLQADTDGKTKLLLTVSKRVTTLAMEVDNLFNRIYEKRLILNKQREENKPVLQRYEEIFKEQQLQYEQYYENI